MKDKGENCHHLSFLNRGGGGGEKTLLAIEQKPKELWKVLAFKQTVIPCLVSVFSVIAEHEG